MKQMLRRMIPMLMMLIYVLTAKAEHGTELVPVMNRKIIQDVIVQKKNPKTVKIIKIVLPILIVLFQQNHLMAFVLKKLDILLLKQKRFQLFFLIPL